jgi:glycosyltransferase involved in cell wall biosynthesis
VRILYHHRTLADGAEGIHIAEMVKAFRELGHEVDLLGPAPADTVQNAAGRARGRFRALLPEPAVEAISLAYNAPEWLELRRAIGRHRPDLIYKRHARFDISPSILAARFGIPLALEVNAVYSARPYSDFEPLALHGVAKRLERRAFELANLVVTVSTPLARQVRALADARVVVMPNGADPERFDPARADRARMRSKLGVGDHLVIGWMGILRAWHGLDLLLDAMTAVPEAVLLVIGDGPERSWVEQRAEALNLRGRLVITGRVPHAEMPHYIAAMDIAVVADERTGIASPMKLIEYMASGRAVVAPQLENIADVLVNGRTGLLFTRGDANALGVALRRLADHEDLRHELGAHARGEVESVRNWVANAGQILNGVMAGVAERAPSR